MKLSVLLILARKRAWLLAVVLVTSMTTASNATPTVRTVALLGDTAPGTIGGETFSRLIVTYHNSFVIDAQGHVAFFGKVEGDGVSELNDVGIWSEATGVLRLVAREGDPAPGTSNGVVFARIAERLYESLSINPSGQLAFNSFLEGDGVTASTSSGYWVGDANSLRLGARAGDMAPGIPNANFGSFHFLGAPRINSAGEVAIHRDVIGDDVTAVSDRGIWAGPPGDLQLVVRKGDPAPGLPSGATIRSMSGSELSDNGGFAFRSSHGSDFTIWKTSGDSLELVTTTGDPAPGIPGVSFKFLLPPAVNAFGEVAFLTTLLGDGVDETNSESIWSERSGTLEMIARSGDQATGTPEGVVFGGSTRGRSLSGVFSDDAGGVLFSSVLTGDGIDDTNNRGFWSDTFGTLDLVARLGDQAPGLADGTIFTNHFGRSIINAAGQVAFVGRFDENGVEKTGIWAQDRMGILQLVVREGGELEVSPGEYLTADGIHFDFAFGDQGHLAFGANVQGGGPGLFVSSLVAVPEPSTAVLFSSVIYGILALSSRRNQSRDQNTLTVRRISQSQPAIH